MCRMIPQALSFVSPICAAKSGTLYVCTLRMLCRYLARWGLLGSGPHEGGLTNYLIRPETIANYPTHSESKY